MIVKFDQDDVEFVRALGDRLATLTKLSTKKLMQRKFLCDECS
jgi:hypothetical protein